MTDDHRKPRISPVAWLTAAPWRAFVLIFLVNLAVSGFFLTKIPTRYVRPHTRWEISAVAMALYERGEFADPYALPTGPTAHMPPFQPALMAAIYHLLGPTLAAGYVVLSIAIAFHGVMYGMLPWLGGRLGLGREAGLVGGLVGALIPRWPSEVEAPAAVAIGLMAVAFVRRWDEHRATSVGSFGLGLAIGLSFLISPSLLAVALGFMAFELAWMRAPGRWRWAGAMLLGMTLACTPWTWRNYTRLDDLFFIRSNFGLELRMGNHEGAGPTLDSSPRAISELHPRSSAEEARKVAQLGEAAYMREAGREAISWIRSHPVAFLRLIGLRVAQFWLGPVDYLWLALRIAVVTLLSAVGLWRVLPKLGVPQRAAILIPLVTYPLVYYVVGFEARYREPLDGLSLLLATTGVLSVASRESVMGARAG